MATTSRPAGRAATILDVARLAEVSRQTVTRSLNDLPDVSPATRERVLQAARELNYRPNRAAQGLVRGRQVTVGLVVEDLRNPYFPELASELTRAAAEHGWGVLLCDAGDSGAADRATVAQRLASMAERVDAVVSFTRRDAWGAALTGIPTVTLDNHATTADTGVVEIDDRAAARLAIEHFVRLGRRRLAMIDAGPEPSGRALAFRAELADRGLAWSETSEVRVNESTGDGIRAAESLIEWYPDVDGALVFNDVLAVGALKGFARLGVRVPEDVAVIGMDGLDLGTLVTPELTTLALDKADLARRAVDMIAALLAGDDPGRSRISRTLVVRESAPAPPRPSAVNPVAEDEPR
ncbi:LacI family DNA-binding transcriptional regulator [Frigoribacterium sp. 2-23]|uniref:LacI family DNA-binding transcriptional regulator n=1 Tax=Frigoribacterium sp. 2-23 TaxID=3415006 RepID=UPI003C705545